MRSLRDGEQEQVTFLRDGGQEKVTSLRDGEQTGRAGGSCDIPEGWREEWRAGRGWWHP